jgi:L-aspartate oxidase
MDTIHADFVVVGSGIAGLRAALELRDAGSVLVLTKDAVRESATSYAQGGIAAAIGEDDSIELHERDTLIAGDGLCEPEAVRVLVEEAPRAIGDLLAWGAAFDRSGGELQRTREGAHSRSRILHAHGDSTGREISDTLTRRVAAETSISVRSLGLASRLLLEEGAGSRAVGVEFLDANIGAYVQVFCRAILLATGGLGQVFSDTTNPSIATGDGPALAFRAGATLADMEFVQFHPTALALAGAPRFLLSEALRGEGAILRNPAGERFMASYHPDAELAPRDVVARAIEMELRNATPRTPPKALTCYLDATQLPAEQLRQRFPRIGSTLRAYGLSLEADRIPIRPAAHYAMGGIWTDLHGRSTVAGLYAAGEAACTGVHGANRLASNSLLEGLVFGARAGKAMLEDDSGGIRHGSDRRSVFSGVPKEKLQGMISGLQELMWQSAGVIRDAVGLRYGLVRLL